MDLIVQGIAAFSGRFDSRSLSDSIARAATDRVVDTLGCALGGSVSEAARIAHTLGEGAVPRRWPGRVIGRRERTTAEVATFVNSAMARYLDFNDTGPGSHPSDCIGGLIAIAEPAGADGKRFLSAVIVTYEVLLRLAFGTDFRKRGFDQGFVSAIATAAGTGHLLGLDAQKIAHAVSIATVSNVALRASRAGQLSYWKSAATPFHVRNGLIAALLAAEGMTGPERPFDGRFGLFEQLTGPFELSPFPDAGGDYMLPTWSRLKYWPVEYNAQIAVWAGLALREKVTREEIETIAISTYYQAWHEIGSEPAKWAPTTRETADHSMPYIFSRAFFDGAVTVSSFDEAAYRDEDILKFMSLITVSADDEMSAMFPAEIPIRVSVRTKSGGELVIERKNPLGHDQNPMTSTDVAEKFTRLCSPYLGQARTKEAAEGWNDVAQAGSLSPLLDLLETKPEDAR